MKKVAITIFIMSTMILMSGCMYSHNYDENGNELKKEQVIEIMGGIKDMVKSEIINAISNEINSDIVETTIDLELTAENKEIFYVNLANDAEATIRYTYSTEDKDGVVFRYYSTDRDPTLLELSPATEEAYDTIWKEENVTLKKGENTFYLTGSGVHCKMILKIEGIGKDNVIYSGTTKGE